MLCFITSHQVLWAWIWGCTRITRGQSRGILSALQGRPWTSLCAPVRVVASLSPDSLGTLTRPGRFGTPWQPLPSGVWAIGVPGRCVCVCVCVLWGGAWEGRQGWREWVPSTVWALGTPWRGRLGQLLPMGALAVQAYSLQTFMSVISSVCVSGKARVSNFNLPLQDSF